MYVSPKLERFGSFRELTLQQPNFPPTSNKTTAGNDAWVGYGLCTPDPDLPGGVAGCRS